MFVITWNRPVLFKNVNFMKTIEARKLFQIKGDSKDMPRKGIWDAGPDAN
jgi:hypothetical protein